MSEEKIKWFEETNKMTTIYRLLILEFVKDLEKLESCRLFGKDPKLYPLMVEIIKKWEEKLK